MTLTVQQHIAHPILIFTHAGLVTANEVLEGCDLLVQLCENDTYDAVIDLTEAMYVWESVSINSMVQMMVAFGHSYVRHITYVIPGAEHHDLAEVLREGYAHANLTYKLSFTNTPADAIMEITVCGAGRSV